MEVGHTGKHDNGGGEAGGGGVEGVGWRGWSPGHPCKRGPLPEQLRGHATRFTGGRGR
jgi:hypothetical protein